MICSLRPITQTLACATLAIGLCGARASAQVTVLTPSPNLAWSTANDLSFDGRFVSGNSSPDRRGTPFRYDRNSGTFDEFVFDPSVFGCVSFGISGTGQWLVGSYAGQLTQGDSRAYRWNPETGLELLGFLGNNTHSSARRANHDGSVVAGEAFRYIGGQPYYKPFRWTAATGMTAIPLLTGADYGFVTGMDATGNSIVGYSSLGRSVAWRWSAATGTVPLSTGSPDATSSCIAFAVSADASTIVGHATVAETALPIACRWIGGAIAPELLALPTGFIGSQAFSVSADGSVIGGKLVGHPEWPGSSASIWTAQTGMLRLQDYLATFGITLPSGLNFEEVNAISADGLTLAGDCTDDLGRNRGWVVHIPAPAAIPLAACACLLAPRYRRPARIARCEPQAASR